MRIGAFDIETAPQLELLPLALEAARARAEARREDPSGVDEEAVKREMSLSPVFGRIVAVGTLDDTQEEPTIFVGQEEREILEVVWHNLEGADLFITYNGIAFDVPFLKLRSSILGVRSVVEISTKRYIWLNHMDLYQLITAWGGNRSRYLKLDLETVAKVLGIEVPVGNGAEVPKLFEAGDWDAIKRHLEADLKATLGVWERLGRPGLVEVEELLEVPF